MVLDIDGSLLTAQFLGDDGGILDRFTLLKGGDPNTARIIAFKLCAGCEFPYQYVATLTWTSVPGRTYALQIREEADQWFDLDSVIATGRTTQWVGQVPDDWLIGFLRVVLRQ